MMLLQQQQQQPQQLQHGLLLLLIFAGIIVSSCTGTGSTIPTTTATTTTTTTTTWTQLDTNDINVLQPSDTDLRNNGDITFGASVAMADKNNNNNNHKQHRVVVVVVGAPPNVRKTNPDLFSPYSATTGGAAYVYTVNNNNDSNNNDKDKDSNHTRHEQVVMLLTTGEKTIAENNAAAAASYWPLFGAAVAMDEDATTAVVGAPMYRPCTYPHRCQNYNNLTGAAYMFHLNNNNNNDSNNDQLEPTTILIPPDASDDNAAAAQFGNAVAMSDASTVLVGPYVFVRNDKNDNDGSLLWTFQQKLVPTQNNSSSLDDSMDDSYGYAVAMEGDTALVAGGGTVYVFVRQRDHDDSSTTTTTTTTSTTTRASTATTAVWTLVAQLSPRQAHGTPSFASSVALSGDTAMIGTKSDGTGMTGNPGAVYVYSTRTWTQTQKLVSDVGHGFGNSVSISGSVAVIGDTMPMRTLVGTGGGRMFLYAKGNDGLWVEQDMYDPLDTQEGYNIGAYVSVSGDSVVVGTGTYISGEDYQTTGGSWTFAVQALKVVEMTASSKQDSDAMISSCEANPRCNALGLKHQCCPTRDGWILDCCLGNDVAVQRACQLNPRCDALGLTGSCCPTQDRANGDRFLDCCETIDSQCHGDSVTMDECEVLSARDYLVELQEGETRNQISSSANGHVLMVLTVCSLAYIFAV